MSTTGRTGDRTGDPPRLVRVTVTRLSGAQPVPWIRKTVAGSPMGWSITICGDPVGAEGNTDGGGPTGGGFSAAVGDVEGPARLPVPASVVPAMTPAAISAAAAATTPAAIKARRRRRRAGGAASGTSPAVCLGGPTRCSG